MAFLLPAVMDIASVDRLKAELDGVLQQPLPLALDGSQVERIDAAGLQLLAALFHHIDAIGAAVQWQGISNELRSSAALVGLENNLRLA